MLLGYAHVIPDNLIAVQFIHYQSVFVVKLEVFIYSSSILIR